MAYKKKSDAIRYNNEFNKQAYDRINLTVAKGRKPEIQLHAKTQNESTNEFINRAVDETIERDNRRTGGTLHSEKQTESDKVV